MLDMNKELIIFAAHFDWTRQIFKNLFLSHASRNKKYKFECSFICSNSKHILLLPLIIHDGEEDLYELCMFLCFFSFVGSLCRCHRWQGVPETTRRILRAILDNSCAIHMNFAGRGGQHGLQDTKILRLVVGKIVCCPYYCFFIHISCGVAVNHL